jgi:hypothetical protein
MKIDHWFIGIVENIADPLNAGRVQVRCYEYHELDDVNSVPSENLPWATPLLPLTSASSAGTGTSPTGLMAGSWVFGFFRDADQQDPVILGSVPGVESLNGTSIPADASSSSVGAAYSSATNTSQYTEGSPSAGAANTSALNGDDIAAQQNNTSTSTSAFINNLVRIAVGENGTSNSAGRSKYGVNDAWCAAFLTWCIKQTGAIPTSDLPANPNAVAEWLKWPNGKGGKYVIKIANPKVLYAGDILIRDAAQDHIGLVSKGGSITGGYTSVEGNTGKNRSVMVRDKKGGFNYVLRWKGAFGGTDVATPMTLSPESTPTGVPAGWIGKRTGPPAIVFDGTGYYPPGDTHIPATAYKIGGQYLNGDITKFVVVNRQDYNNFKMGSKVYVYNHTTKQATWAIAGDRGPTQTRSEMSVATAEAIGVKILKGSDGKYRNAVDGNYIVSFYFFDS